MSSPTTVFHGGTVIISAENETTTSAIAFSNGTVVAHGDDALALIDQAGTEVIDLAGGTIVPALGDGHCHPLLGGVEDLGPEIRNHDSVDGILASVGEWKAAHPEAEWIVGGSYDATLEPGGLFDAKRLDEVTGDTPTILRSFDYHTAWVNSAALRAGGITSESADPHLGRIVRREDGTPLGTLQEAAANNFLADVVPAFTTEQKLGAIESATRGYAEQGMTWIQDAWVEAGPAGAPDLEIYLAAVRAGRLHTRVNLAFRAEPSNWREQLDIVIALRERVQNEGADRLSANTIKFFMDGVIESHTAALSEPYADRPDDRGLPNWTYAELEAATVAFDAANFQLHIHAIGDESNRLALTALENVNATNPERDRAHVIAHISLLNPEDTPRFAAAGVVANFEPYWAQCDAIMRDLTIPHIGNDRAGWQYSIGSLQRSGATVTFGSDWPVTTVDWRPAFATAVTRKADLQGDSWIPEERVSAAEALAAYTSGIARQALAANRGTLAIGQVADAAWLSADPLAVEPEAIPEISVQGTWLAGDRTF